MRKFMVAGAVLFALICGSPVAFGGTHTQASTKLVSAKKSAKHGKKHSAKKHNKHHKAQSHAAK